VLFSKLYKGDQLREDEMGGHVARMGQVRNSYILIEKPERKRILGRPKCKWEDDIRMEKVNVKFFLFLTKHHTTKVYWESGSVAPRIL
jgi:hypothetical protein